KVTIDFGDGRKLERTLTGNSIHYVLDSEGRPVEAIPGLYGPQAFLAQLANARALVETVAHSPIREDALTSLHTQRRNEAMTNWISDLEKAGVAVAVAPTATTTNSGAQTPNSNSAGDGAAGGPAPRFPRAA